MDEDISRYATTARSGCHEPLPIDHVPHAEMSAARFQREYFLQHRPVLVRKCFDDPTCPIAHFGALDASQVLGHDDVRDVAAETSSQVPMDIMHAVEYKDELSCGEACNLLQARRDAATASGGDSGSRLLHEALYAKVAITECVALSECVTHFLNASEPLAPVAHPMLLKPGGYFAWAYVGEAFSGSKTHVDVMGSDAWLVVLHGKKLWALCHPADKHLVMNEQGKFANLLHVDHTAFPMARFARIAYFLQCTGDAIFVPGDAPHTVMNLECSTSITFNFILNKGQRTWMRMMQHLVDEDTADGIADLVLTEDGSAELVRVITVRLYLPARCWQRGGGGGNAACFLSDYGARVCLEDIYTAFEEQHGTRFRQGGIRTIGVPIGHSKITPLGGDRRVVVYYAVEASGFAELWDRVAIAQPDGGAVDLAEMAVPTTTPLSLSYAIMVDAAQRRRCSLVPEQPFGLRSSHIGVLPDFPPLSVMLRQSWVFDQRWMQKPLGGVLQARRRARSLQAAPAGNDPLDVGRMALWHYTRFPWSPDADDAGVGPEGCSRNSNAASCPWSCSTYLFYSSPYLDGPVNLFPLEQDVTLQSVDMLLPTCPTLQATSAPHFEQFRWRMDEVLEPCGRDDGSVMTSIIDLGDDLMAELCKKLLLSNEGPSFLAFCSGHAPIAGVASVDWATVGFDKLAMLAVYFSTLPALVGFTYSFVFRNIAEPSTLCLIGSAAQRVMERVTASPLARVATDCCLFVEDRATIEQVDASYAAAVRALPQLTALDGVVSAQHLRQWIGAIVETKRRDIAGLLNQGGDDDGSEASLRSRVMLRHCDELSQRFGSDEK